MDRLSIKIMEAEQIIKESYEKNNGNIFVSFSGGKDSTILMHIAKNLFPDIRVVFSNTTNELIEIIKYVKQFKDVIHVAPAKPFKEVVKAYGFPLVSKESSQKINELKKTNGYRTRALRYWGDKKGSSQLPQKWRYLADQKFDVTHKCCQILKKDPLKNWAKKNGNPKPLIALMSDESKLRQQLSLYGADDGEKIYPFLRTEWNEQDIWEYAKRFNIRFAECYYEQKMNGKIVPPVKRTGCAYCFFGGHLEEKDRFARNKQVSPKRHEKMMRLENNGVTFKEAIDIVLSPIPSLNISGVTLKDVKMKEGKEIYIVEASTKVIECPSCKKKGLNIAEKSYGYITSFKDTLNEETGNRRVIECHHDLWTCKSCNMTLNNNLHMFEQRFKITKRAIDYIFKNLDKKSADEICSNIGISIEDLFEIIEFNYNKAFIESKQDKRPNIWFNNKNQLINTY